MADLYGSRRGRDVLFGPKVIPVALDAEWNEADHPRGQPGNAGQFGPGGGGSGGGGSGTTHAHEQSSEPWYAHERWFKAEQEPEAEPAPMPEPLPAATFTERARTLGESSIAWTTSQKKNAALAAAALNAAGFQAMTENPSGSKADARFAAIGSPTNGILVNQRSAFWKDPEAAAKHNHAIGHLSTPHPLGVLLHEIAHTQYPDVQAYWMADSQKTVAAKVSNYARTNPREFVSETFAGLHSGLSYDDDVMRLYGLFTRTGASPSPEPMPKLPPQAHTERAKQDHAAIKQMVTKIEETIRRDRPDLHDALIERYPMRLLQHALDTLWETRMQESGSGKGGMLTKADERLNDVIRGEISRRVEISHSAREKRAVEYAYMSDEEVSHAMRLDFGGNSRMKPGLKRQLGLLPPSHLKAISEMGGSINAVDEIPALSPDHPYAPGMIPAGLYEPQLRRISVGDQVSFPDGGRRMLGSRAHTLRHEIGHAIDDVTIGRMSLDPSFVQAVDAGIERMTDQERDLAGYWIGATAKTSTDAWVAKRAETFAEIYAYAYDDGTDDPQERGVAFGGLKDARLFEIFGPAKKIMREKLDNFFKDELGFSTSGGANV